MNEKTRFSHLEFEEEGKKSVKAALEEELSRKDVIAKNISETKKEAEECFYAGKFDRALILWGKLLEYEDTSLAWERQCDAMFLLNRADEALSCANLGLKHFPNTPALLALKGLSYAHFGDSKRAMEYSDASLQLDANNAQAHFCRGAMLYALKKRGSDYCFQKALEFADDMPFFTLKIALCLKAQGEHSRSLFYLQKLLKEKMTTPFLLTQIAECQHALGFLDEACIALGEALLIDPLHEKAGKLLEDIQKKNKSLTRKLLSRMRK